MSANDVASTIAAEICGADVVRDTMDEEDTKELHGLIQAIVEKHLKPVTVRRRKRRVIIAEQKPSAVSRGEMEQYVEAKLKDTLERIIDVARYRREDFQSIGRTREIVAETTIPFLQEEAGYIFGRGILAEPGRVDTPAPFEGSYWDENGYLRIHIDDIRRIRLIEPDERYDNPNSDATETILGYIADAVNREESPNVEPTPWADRRNIRQHVAESVANLDVGENSRSGWYLFTLSNGDTILGFYPHGDEYEMLTQGRRGE